MFVGEGPGAEEDRQGLPFVGRSGQLLDRLMLEEIGITRDRVYIANVVKCRPPGNRDPLPARDRGLPALPRAQIELIGPKVVVTLGKFAGQLLLDSKVGITKLRGQQYPFGRRGADPDPAPGLRAAGRGRAPRPRCGPTSCGPSWPLAAGGDPMTLLARTRSVSDTQAAGRGAGRAGAPGRRDPVGRRARRGQDRLHPGVRRRPRRDRAHHQPDLHVGQPLRGPARAQPPRRVPARADDRGGSTSACPRCSTTAG